jgi:integrase/recombinase XerD
VIETLFTRRSALRRHLDAPLLHERERYLTHLLQQGTREEQVRLVAARLLRLIRLMDMSMLRLVEVSEIDIATSGWRAEAVALRLPLPSDASAIKFQRTALNWLNFHQSLIPTVDAPEPYADVLSEYLSFVNFTVSPVTAATYFRCASGFLSSVQKCQPILSQMSTIDIERYIESLRSRGCRPSSIANECTSLRNFLRFTEGRGWTPVKLSRTIRSPRRSRFDPGNGGPRWKDVRRLLASCNDTIADTRARAVMSLCAIYGLRVGEVANLSLNDFDWNEEAFTVHRTKSGRVQRFPLRFEVGEAILRYIQLYRPRCSSHLLFVTLRTPYRRVSPSCISGFIKYRMERLKIKSSSMGAHSLRHSCATELLRLGVSLENIADLLGHRNLKTVSLYAKCSPRSLKDVALMSLESLM